MPKTITKPSQQTKRSSKEKYLPSDFGTFGTTPNDIDGRNISANTVESEVIEPTIEDFFREEVNFREFPDDYLIINDVLLSDVPSVSVSVESNNDVLVAETLRSRAPIVSTKGNQNITVSISLVFPPGEAQSYKLRKLVSQLQHNPLLYIFNGKIRKSLGVEDISENTIFILETASMRSDVQHVGSIILDMTMHYFNYKPFSNHFWYNTHLPWKTTVEEQPDTPEPSELYLGDLTSYEASSFTLDYEAEKLAKDLRTEVIILDSDRDNVPVNMPMASDSWTFYSAHMYNNTWAIPERTSDYVGFELRVFDYITPDDPAERASAGSFANIFQNTDTDFPSYNAAYLSTADMAKSPEEKTASERFAEDIIQTSETIGGGRIPVKIVRASTGARAKLQLLDNNGRIVPEAHRLFSELCYPRGETDKYRSEGVLVDGRLVKMVQKVSERFPNKTIKIFSGIRNYGVGKGHHAKGAAIDFKVEGIPNKKLFIFIAKTFKKGGAGYYPNNHPSGGSRFVHMDARDKGMTLWVDESGAGKKSSYNKKHELLIGLRAGTINNENDIQEEALHLTEEKNEFNSQVTKADKPKYDFAPQQTIDTTRDKVEKVSISQDYRDEEKRLNWIAKVSDNIGVDYYSEDPKLRNIFYKDLHCFVSSNSIRSDISDSVNMFKAKDFVTSSISVTFGNRISSKKLLSQETSTWQFLGAGNKTGTLVFTFAGQRGRASADNIKKMIYESRRNAKKFSSLIPEAGSMKLRWDSLSIDESSNTILALLASKREGSLDQYLDIVVTDFSEQSDPSGSDKHQLVINFIVQEFVEEKLDRNILSSLDQKKRIISVLMDEYIASAWYGDGSRKKWGVGPNPKYVVFRDPKLVTEENKLNRLTPSATGEWRGNGRPWARIGNKVPAWLAPIIIEAATYTMRANEDIPLNYGSELFDVFGAGKHIKGNKFKVAYGSGLVGATGYTTGVSRKSDPLDIVNNRKAIQVFRDWSNEMDLIVQKVLAHASASDFDKYFHGVGEEIIESLVSNMGECYDDMRLPSFPDGGIKLPPDFYIYDDSDEDPAISTLTNDSNMTMFLKKHIQNERASVNHYMQQYMLGGSYASRSLPRIMENRKHHLSEMGGTTRKSGEIEFMTFSQMIAEGTRSWEPVFYRPTDPLYQESTVKKWTERINSSDGGDENSSRQSFFEKLVELSPYIGGKHRHWVSGSEPMEELVADIYEDNWNKTAFGPNPDYKHSDKVMSGNISEAQENAARENIKKTPEQEIKEEIQRQEKAGPNQTIMEDGTLTFGSNEEERMAMQEQARNSVFGDMFGGSFSFLAALNEVLNPVVHAVTTSAAKLVSHLDHKDIGSIFVENKEDEVRAEAAAAIALGTKSKDLSIRRAFPTFKIYFIEDDEAGSEISHGRTIRAFDDFYSYSAVQEIRVVRSRKVAADLAVIRITNIGGKLLRRRFGEQSQYERDHKAKYGIEQEYETGIFADTERENPFERMVLQDGVKVQIRLGYTSNPDHLESVFLGSIVEISPSDDGKILELVCQGFGAELEGVELGPLEDGPIFYSSQQVLSGAIIQDSIVNFGRRQKTNRFNSAQLRHQFTGGEGDSPILGSGNPTRILDEWSRSRQTRQMFKYPFKNVPQDDNIFCPPPHIYTSTWDRFWDNACTYRPLKQTPWQIFKEHELRHPGYVSLAVPYGHSTRMTMFFGTKNQHYWAHPPTGLELFLAETAAEEIVKLRGLKASKVKQKAFREQLAKIAEQNVGLANAIKKGIHSFSHPVDVGFKLGEMFGRYRPFRNFHYFDSSHHLLKNSISTNRDGTFNEVEVLYFEDENEIEEDNINDLLSNVEQLSRGQHGVMACQLDENIPEEYIRSYREEFPSCVTDTMARRYVQGLFSRLLRDSYKGELIVLGEPTLKPYDVCLLNDSSINMTGPVEVEQVEHIFNREQGFISIVTPDMCIDINDYYSASTLGLTASSLAYAWGLNDPDLTIGIAAIASPFALAAYMGGVKIIKNTQDGTPVISTPLVLNGKPFVGVTIGPKNGSLYLSLAGKWSQYHDDLSNAWRKYDVAESLFHQGLENNEGFLEFFGADVDESIPLAEQ